MLQEEHIIIQLEFLSKPSVIMIVVVRKDILYYINFHRIIIIGEIIEHFLYIFSMLQK